MVAGRRWSRPDDYPAEVARMTLDQLLDYCLAKPGAWTDRPFGDDLVVKVAEKIFAFTNEDVVAVKCGGSRQDDPSADEWLRQYPEDATVMAYLGRSGWNSLRLRGAIPDLELRDAVDTSYELVVARLPRSRRP